MNDALTLGAEVSCGLLATVHRGSRRGRTVAVKRARPDVPGAATALRREARILTAARHPAIVPVLDLLDDDVVPALVLGWADGGSLHDLLADGPLNAADLLHLLQPLAGGLDAMHAAGVAHLDVSVHNVLLAAAGPILVDPAPPGAGTPGYADPVVAAGGPASARSDVFGLAACAHVALTGRLPRTAGGLAVGLALPPAVARALAAGVDPEPRRRPPSASAFLGRLEEALGDGEGSAARRSPARGHRRDEPPPTDPTATPPDTARPGAPLAPSAVDIRPSSAAGADGDRSPAAPGGRGRPVARAAGPVAGTARTWPFDRWQEQADAADERRVALRSGAGTAPRRHRRVVVVLLAVLLATTLAIAAVLWPGIADRDAAVRTSAPDSIRRPPATRPPPTATPGGNP